MGRFFVGYCRHPRFSFLNAQARIPGREEKIDGKEHRPEDHRRALCFGRQEGGQGGRRPDRPDPHPGRHRNDGVPAVRGDGGSPGEDREVRLLRRPQHAAGRVRERRRPPVPPDGRREARDLLLPRRERHLPPGPRRAVRRPRQDDAGLRLAHPNGRRHRHDGDRRGGTRRRRGDGGRTLLHDVSESGQGEPHREAPAVGDGQGRHPQAVRDPHHEGRHRRHHRILRPRDALDQLHWQSHDHEHGSRGGRDDLSLPV